MVTRSGWAKKTLGMFILYFHLKPKMTLMAAERKRRSGKRRMATTRPGQMKSLQVSSLVLSPEQARPCPLLFLIILLLRVRVPPPQDLLQLVSASQSPSTQSAVLTILERLSNIAPLTVILSCRHGLHPDRRLGHVLDPSNMSVDGQEPTSLIVVQD